MSMIAETNSKTMIAILQPKMKGVFITKKKDQHLFCEVKEWIQTIKNSVNVYKEEKGQRAIVK